MKHGAEPQRIPALLQLLSVQSESVIDPVISGLWMN